MCVLLCAVKCTCSCKLFLTNITFITFPSCVCSFVCYQVVSCCKSFVTNIAFIRSLSSVCSFVYYQDVSCCKSFVTNITFIRFLSCVYYSMSYKGACTCKSFVANITFMNVLSSFLSKFYECLETSSTLYYIRGGWEGGGKFCHINNIKERNY